MKKFIVETYYTCTFKTVHTLENLDDTELSKIDKRTDGTVEVIDVKLNNRKTKKIGAKMDEQSNNAKIEKVLPDQITNQIKNQKNDKRGSSVNLKVKNNARFKLNDSSPDETKFPKWTLNKDALIASYLAYDSVNADLYENDWIGPFDLKCYQELPPSLSEFNSVF